MEPHGKFAYVIADEFWTVLCWHDSWYCLKIDKKYGVEIAAERLSGIKIGREDSIDNFRSFFFRKHFWSGHGGFRANWEH